MTERSRRYLHRATGLTGRAGDSRIVRLIQKIHHDEDGATATEYLMIMVFVVMPIGLMFPVFLKMVKTYGVRMTSLMGLPFP